MTLRITDPAQLAMVSPTVRRQLEGRIPAPDAPGNYSPDYSADGSVTAQASRRRARPEQDAGRQLIAWADVTAVPAGVIDPARTAELSRELGHPPRVGDFLAHTPNGGFRDPVEAAIFYGQGVRRGWPDYTLYLPVGRWCGLVGELKAPDGAKPDEAQLKILRRLELVGWCACVWWGADDACRSIERYLAVGR